MVTHDPKAAEHAPVHTLHLDKGTLVDTRREPCRMKYLHLVWARCSGARHGTLLTLLSVIGRLFAFRAAGLGAHRHLPTPAAVLPAPTVLVTFSKVSFTMALPKSLLPRIQAVPGVAEVSYANWFGGIYQEPKNFFANEAVAPNFLDLYPEWIMPEEQRKAFKETRTGAIVGEGLAKATTGSWATRYPCRRRFFRRKGGNTWSFNLVGIFHVQETKIKGHENQMLFHWK